MWIYLQNLKKDSLFRNSFYLMLNTAFQAGIGFVFWLVAARIYRADDVGLATSLISAATLTSVFSMLGLNSVMIRYLPNSERKNEQLSTALVLTGIASFIVASIFLVWSTKSHYPFTNTASHFLLYVIFSFFVLSITINSIIDSAFVAFRSTQYVLLKNIVLSLLKVLLLFIATGLGFLGIVGAVAAATLTSFIFGCTWLTTKFKYKPILTIDRATIRETKQFAMGNYLGTMFGVLPSTVISLIIVTKLGPQYAAFFYMPTMMVTLLNVIPSSTVQSLYAEVSHDELGLIKYFKKSITHIATFSIPSALILWLLGGSVLKYFGNEYFTAGTGPLHILILSSLIGAANYLGDTLLNIKKRPGLYLTMNAINAIAIIVPTYFFAPLGLEAIAWTNFFGQAFTAAIYLAINWQLVSSLLDMPPSHRESVER